MDDGLEFPSVMGNSKDASFVQTGKGDSVACNTTNYKSTEGTISQPLANDSNLI